MASIYPNTRLTNYGRELIARSQATGKKLQYIKLVTGDGQLDNQNIDTMTSVIAPKLECPFTSNGEFVGDGQFRIEFAVGNSTVNSGHIVMAVTTLPIFRLRRHQSILKYSL